MTLGLAYHRFTTHLDSVFLIDSIAQQNKRYCSIWPENRELDEQALVDGFVALVLQVHKLDAKLQKRFDQVVPKKTTETTFVRA